MSEFEKSEYTTRLIDLKHPDGLFEVSRFRDSEGGRVIAITIDRDTIIGGDDDQIILAISSDKYGDEYEQVAFSLANAIDEIACQPCLLEKG